MHGLYDMSDYCPNGSLRTVNKEVDLHLLTALKKKNYVPCLQEIAYMIAESRIDVQVDPLLHATCQKDILSLCTKIQQGEGRRK